MSKPSVRQKLIREYETRAMSIPGADRVTTFRHWGCEYTVVATVSDTVVVFYDGRICRNPSKGVMTEARKRLYLIVVEEVNRA